MRDISMTAAFRTEQRARLHQFYRDGALLAPFLPDSKTTASFADLACALADCCGVKVYEPDEKEEDGVEVKNGDSDRVDNIAKKIQKLNNANAKPRNLDRVEQLYKEFGGREQDHIIFILCDGMGTGVIEAHLDSEGPTVKSPLIEIIAVKKDDTNPAEDIHTISKQSCQDSNSFLLTHNNPERLRSIFPATTPAALTTLSTGVWPGQHGAPGWELRDQKKCEFGVSPMTLPKDEV